jgi:hypothetical protein
MRGITMRSPLYIALLVAGLCLMAACEVVGLGSSDDDPLVGPTWRLVAFEDASGNKTEVGADDIVLTFTDSGSVRGQTYPEEGRAPENTYEGIYETTPGDSLSVRGSSRLVNLISTRVGTLPGSRYEEYLLALVQATTYQIEDRHLRINYSNGKALHFKAAESK